MRALRDLLAAQARRTSPQTGRDADVGRRYPGPAAAEELRQVVAPPRLCSAWRDRRRRGWCHRPRPDGDVMVDGVGHRHGSILASPPAAYQVLPVPG